MRFSKNFSFEGYDACFSFVGSANFLVNGEPLVVSSDVNLFTQTAEVCIQYGSGLTFCRIGAVDLSSCAGPVPEDPDDGGH